MTRRCGEDYSLHGLHKIQAAKMREIPIAVDLRGNIYTGEVWNGERVQRFVPNS